MLFLRSRPVTTLVCRCDGTPALPRWAVSIAANVMMPRLCGCWCVGVHGFGNPFSLLWAMLVTIAQHCEAVALPPAATRYTYCFLTNVGVCMYVCIPVVCGGPGWTLQLADSFLFEGLEIDDLTIIVDAMRFVSYLAGSVVFRQGDPGDLFYIVGKGLLRVMVNDAAVATLQPRSHFGELALMFNTPRWVLPTPCLARDRVP